MYIAVHERKGLSHLPVITDIQVGLQCILIGIYVGQTGIDAGFVQVLGFPVSVLFPQYSTHTHSCIRGIDKGPVSGHTLADDWV